MLRVKFRNIMRISIMLIIYIALSTISVAQSRSTNNDGVDKYKEGKYDEAANSFKSKKTRVTSKKA